VSPTSHEVLISAFAWASYPDALAQEDSFVEETKGRSASSLNLKLSGLHVAGQYAAVYRTARRIHIPEALEQPSAERLHNALASQEHWNTVLNSETSVYDVSPEVIAGMPSGRWNALRGAVLTSAATKFHYLFENHRLSEQGEPYRDAAHPFAGVVKFLNSVSVLAWFRALTGHSAIARADVQATRYGAGHFLHVHDDLDQDKGRLAAYVLNLTPDWRPEWGGVLHFLDDDGHVAEGYVPRFNALNVFDVGMPHFVSYVAPFALRPRLSVTGWLRRA
jgi:SM-20-related protein